MFLSNDIPSMGDETQADIALRGIIALKAMSKISQKRRIEGEGRRSSWRGRAVEGEKDAQSGGLALGATPPCPE